MMLHIIYWAICQSSVVELRRRRQHFQRCIPVLHHSLSTYDVIPHLKKKMHIDGKNGHDGKNSQRYKVESPKIVIKTLKSICQETRHLNSNVIR